jgi:hypothetical protein
MTIPCNQKKLDDFYYSLIDSKGPLILLFVETSEQWTNQVLSFFNRNKIPYYFFNWNNAEDLRLQLEIVRYPVIQLWCNQKQESELVGYNESELEKLLRLYFKFKRS